MFVEFFINVTENWTGQSRLDNAETSATFDRRHRTKSIKTKT